MSDFFLAPNTLWSEHLLTTIGCGPAEGAPLEAAALAAAPTGSLGNNADFATGLPDVHRFLPPPTTTKAWHLRSLGRDLLKKAGIERRMRWCGSRISRNSAGVSVFARPDRAYGRVAGVCVCGQSVCCPVCAPRIACFRAAEVAEAYRRGKDAGFEVRLETFTKPHALDRRPQALLIEFRAFSDLWRSYNEGGRATRRERCAEGHQLAREINWGRSGWHYHHHRLRYDRSGMFNPDLARAQWLGVLETAGLRTDGADEHAYDCSTVGDEAGARYVSKLSTSVEAQARAVGSEVASSATKGRNMNSLLADHAAGDLDAGNVWVNGVSCVTATKVSSVRWSRGFREKLGMGSGKTDEQISWEEILPTDVLLGELTASQWRGVIRWRAEFALCCAANRGRDAVNEMLSGLSLGKLDDEPLPAVEMSAAEDNCYQLRPGDNIPAVLPAVLPEPIRRKDLC